MDKFKLERASTEEIVNQLVVDVSIHKVKMGLIEKALNVLQTWMDATNAVGDSDTILFDNLNDRVTELELTVRREQ